MRIRTFTAASPQAALGRVRDELGPDAVILAIDEAANGRGVIVRAAVEESAAIAEPDEVFTGAPPAALEDRLEHLLRIRLQAADWPRHFR
jgi:flagellar biosynthesis GTPase FlhF